ncbi:Uncharacterised protein [Mycobacteroides abscessus subsp. massiliense]|nr:Uncharacterised protein [Mycobacteroides abscessus subsp. massiliense]
MLELLESLGDQAGSTSRRLGCLPHVGAHGAAAGGHAAECLARHAGELSQGLSRGTGEGADERAARLQALLHDLLHDLHATFQHLAGVLALLELAGTDGARHVHGRPDQAGRERIVGEIRVVRVDSLGQAAGRDWTCLNHGQASIPSTVALMFLPMLSSASS